MGFALRYADEFSRESPRSLGALAPGGSCHARWRGEVRGTIRLCEDGDGNLVAPYPPAVLVSSLCLLLFRVELLLGLCVDHIMILFLSKSSRAAQVGLAAILSCICGHVRQYVDLHPCLD